MGILNPDYNPDIELVDYGDEINISYNYSDSWIEPFVDLIRETKCPKGFSSDEELIIKYTRSVFSAHFAIETIEKVKGSLTVTHEFYKPWAVELVITSGDFQLGKVVIDVKRRFRSEYISSKLGKHEN